MDSLLDFMEYLKNNYDAAHIGRSVTIHLVVGINTENVRGAMPSVTLTLHRAFTSKEKAQAYIGEPSATELTIHEVQLT